jgi:hypothetical protein
MAAASVTEQIRESGDFTFVALPIACDAGSFYADSLLPPFANHTGTPNARNHVYPQP